MTLEELRAALDAAKAKAEAAPQDKDAQAALSAALKAYEDAVAANSSEQSREDFDEARWDDKTKAYIAKLRGESASHRTKNKDLASKLKVTEEQKRAVLKAIGIESDDEAPEKKIEQLSVQSQQLAFRNAILESAVQYGIAGEEVEYYEFLVAKAANDLAEGDELSEEMLAEIVKKTKRQSKTGANTGVGTAGKGAAPPPGDSKAVTLDQFVHMSITEKSKIFERNPDLYAALVAEAKAKKKLV